MLLLSVIFLPLLGAIGLFFLNERIKQFALTTSLVTFILSIFLWIFFDNSTGDFQFVQHLSSQYLFNIDFYVGIDGISLFFILLTTLLTPICILTGWESIKVHVKEYLACFLFLEVILNLVFSVLDLILFYVFFEAVLIPMFIIIGVWGSRERKIHAAYQFVLYTLVGSVLLLLAIIVMYFQAGTTDLQILMVQETRMFT